MTEADKQLSENRNKNKVFLFNRSELEKRLDPFYYIPELAELEKKVSKLNPEKLRHYVLSIGSGATPKTTESEKYYSDKENGIPFLRVQNLSPTGILEFDDCKYINHETHNNYLKRSQVKEGDLLVKITGVGRMAVSSVAPDGFIGNTNQHMVVIRTGNKKISEIIAAYLNTDIGEKLASRRATGGTRPALDYSALLSIPIIYNEKILEISKNAAEQKHQKKTQAKELLDSIDDYLLKELGITLPEKDNSLKSRVFTSSFSEMSGGRFDAEYSQTFYEQVKNSIKGCNYSLSKLHNLISFIESGSRPKGGVGNIESGVFSIGGEHVNDKCEVGIGKPKYIPFDFHEKNKFTETKLNDIILVKDGATTGKVGVIESEKFANQNINEHVFLIRVNNEIITLFLTYFLHSKIGQVLLKREITGATVTGLTKESVKGISIPVPPIEKQTEIAKHIKGIRAEAKRLQEEAGQEMENAKREIEKMIID